MERIEDFNRRMNISNEQEDLDALKSKAIHTLRRLENDSSVEVMADLEQSILESKRINTEGAKEISGLMQELSARMSRLEESGKKVDEFQSLLNRLCPRRQDRLSPQSGPDLHDAPLAAVGRRPLGDSHALDPPSPGLGYANLYTLQGVLESRCRGIAVYVILSPITLVTM